MATKRTHHDHTRWPLLHQPWHGWTPTGLVFPFFLWIVGLSLVFSRRTVVRAALWRAVELVLLGLLVNFASAGFALPLRWAYLAALLLAG